MTVYYNGKPTIAKTPAMGWRIYLDQGVITGCFGWGVSCEAWEPACGGPIKITWAMSPTACALSAPVAQWPEMHFECNEKKK